MEQHISLDDFFLFIFYFVLINVMDYNGTWRNNSESGKPAWHSNRILE